MPPIKIIGPRGSGKTTLLACAKNMAREKKIHVIRCPHMKDVTPGYAYRTLVERMLGDDEIEKTTSRGFNKVVKAERTTRIKKRETYIKILAALLRKKPVLLLLDEAVHYDEELLGMILQENQQFISDNLPLAMIIAGTPALDRHLSKLDATFINRSEDIYINQLSDEAVREALREPFKKRKVKVDARALELMASWTNNYPYFIQIVGRLVWQVMQQADRSTVDLLLTQEAEPTMQKARDRYYHKVYTDIDRAKLLDQAEQMVDIIESADKALATRSVRERLGEAASLDEDQAREVFDKLFDLGLIWLLDGKVAPALPSFFDYIKRQRN